MSNKNSVLFCIGWGWGGGGGGGEISNSCIVYTWVKVFRIIPEFRILRLTFQRKSASKC